MTQPPAEGENDISPEDEQRIATVVKLIHDGEVDEARNRIESRLGEDLREVLQV